MSVTEVKFDTKRALSELWQTISSGFTFTVFLSSLLFYWAGLASQVFGQNMFVSFMLVTLLFYVVVGLARSLKQVKVFSKTVYRLFHVVISAAMMYVSYFVVLDPLRVALGEKTEDTLASGAVNWAHIVFAYALFLAAYFATIGIRAAARAYREKKARELEAYQSMLKAKK